MVLNVCIRTALIVTDQLMVHVFMNFLQLRQKYLLKEHMADVGRLAVIAQFMNAKWAYCNLCKNYGYLAVSKYNCAQVFA